jgi:hypothetical protein
MARESLLSDFRDLSSFEQKARRLLRRPADRRALNSTPTTLELE